MELKLLWVVGFAVISWLRISYGANCNTFTTQSTCVDVDGCYWSSSQQCACASNVTMDVVFTLDASSSIGSSSFQVALQWMADIIETSLAVRSRVAFIRFATNTQILLDLKQSEAYTKSQLADLALDIGYTGGNTNTVAALKQCMALFSAQGNPYASWVNILITDGNPYAPGQDTDVCGQASQMKSMGITNIIIGVGSSWNPANVDCLVTDSSHIIYVTSYTSGQLDTILPTLTTVTCPVTYHLVISEVQLDLISSSQGSRFVEVYNPSTSVTLKDLNLYGIFEGKVTTSTSLSLPQSSYLVLYDKAAPTMVSCQDCKCTKGTNNLCTNAIYVPCCSSSSSCACYFGGSSMNNDDWDVSIKDSTNNIEVDGVSYDAATWPQILKGYTYALKYVGYDNQLGSNWEQSCNTRGTPGSAPVTNCTWTCTDEQCQLNGASTASCVGAGNTQSCFCDSNYYYFADRTCSLVPPPSNCKAYWLKNGTTRTVQFQWNKAQTDRDHKYILTYYRVGTTDQVITATRTKTVTDYDYARGPNEIAGTVQTQIIGTNGVSAVSSTIDCYPVTMSPTSAPTFHTPYVYVGGDICSNDRCSCNGTDLSCTGPEITKDFVADDNTTQYITVKRLPEGYAPIVMVLWTIQDAGEYVNGTSSNTNSTSSTTRRLLAVNGTNTKTNTTTNSTQGVTPNSGILYFNDPDTEEAKIEFIMHKQTLVVGESKYRLYILNLTECNSTNLQECKPVYPSVLKMKVDITGGGDAFTETKTQKEMPKWLWWLIGALVIFAAILALLGYRYWWKHKQTSQELVETEDQLEHALEENELGFGKDLAVGDVQFNPMATGVPGQKKAPELFAGEMEKRNVDASNVRADVAVEKFAHREQFGQQQGMRRGGNDLAQPLLG